MTQSGNPRMEPCPCHDCAQARYRGSLQWQIDQVTQLGAKPYPEPESIPTPTGEEREQFEKWAPSRGIDVSRYSHGEYVHSYAIEHWETWQAASRRIAALQKSNVVVLSTAAQDDSPERKRWIQAINDELSNMREAWNIAMKRANKAEAECAALRAEKGLVDGG